MAPGVPIPTRCPLRVALTAAFFSVAGASLAWGQPSEGLSRLGAFFESHPEYKTTRSSGWKPYNRDLWFYETRPIPDGTFGGQLRWNVFERALSLRGTRQFEREGGGGWFSVGPTEFSGRCVAIDFHPDDADVVYVGSAAGGLWKSMNGGDTWSTTTDALPTLSIGAVCVLPWNPNIVLIGTGEGTGTGNVAAGKGIFGIGLLKSTDGGATWNPTSLAYGRASTHGFNVIEDNPATHTILAGANDGLWRSTDDGDTWTRVMSNGNFFDVKWKPGDANRVYVAKGRDPFINSQSSNGVYVSTNDGLTFSLAGTGQPNPSSIAKTKIAVCASEPSVIYAHYVNAGTYGTLGIYRSTNDGATWTARNSTINMAGGQGWYNCVIAVDPDDSDRVIAAGVHLYVSDNGGQTFLDLNATRPWGDDTVPHWDNHALVYPPAAQDRAGDAVWIGTDGGPWRSNDDGALWTPRRAGIISYQFYDICVAQSDPIFTMGGTQDNGIPGRSGENSWFHSTFVADGMVCNVDPAFAQIVYAEWQNGNHLKSTDGGINWSSIQTGIAGAGAWVSPVDQDQNDGNRLYTSTNTAICRTTNGGASWQSVAAHFARWISISPVDGDVVWTVGPNAVRHTANDGSSWTLSTTFPGNGLETKVHADPFDPATAYVTFGGYNPGSRHAVMTTDFGATWIDITGDFPDQPANTFIADPGRPGDWYIGSDIGVWRSRDAGATWLPFGTGLVNAVITDLEIRRSARKLVAATYGRGVWEIDLDTDPSSVEPADVAARVLMLDPPFPQPVSGQTTFRFAARTYEPVTLRIVDAQGRLVDSVFRFDPDASVPGSDPASAFGSDPTASVLGSDPAVSGFGADPAVSGFGADPAVSAFGADPGELSNGVIRTIQWSPDEIADGVYFAVLQAGQHKVSRKLVVRR